MHRTILLPQFICYTVQYVYLDLDMAVLLCAGASKNTGYLPLLTKVLWRLMLSLRYMYPSLARCRPNLSQCALGALQHQAGCLESVSVSARPALFSYETWVATRPGHYKRQNKLP